MNRHALLLALLLTTGHGSLVTSSTAQAPALINYQGRLLNGTNLVNGSIGLSLRLFDVSAGGTLLYEDSNSVTVVDGLYSTFIGDNTTFGSLLVALTNAQVWLEVAANGTALTPRERLGAVPYALNVRGLVLTTNDSVALGPTLNRVEPGAGWAAIGGGFGNLISNGANYAVLGGGNQNWIGAQSAETVIGGGGFNRIGTNASGSVIGGGSQNTLRDNVRDGVLAGGRMNAIHAGALYAVISGGQNNNISNSVEYATIAGGNNNRIGENANRVFIGGGANHFVDGGAEHSTVGGGLAHRIREGAEGATIAGGSLSIISTNADYATISGGAYHDIGVGSSYTTIGGGNQNAIEQATLYATIGGGRNNSIVLNASYGFIGGGYFNSVGNNAQYSAIAGGLLNQAQSSAQFGSIGGGQGNQLGSSSFYATVPGGVNNFATSYSLAAGRRARAVHAGSFVWGDSTDADVQTTGDNQFLIRAGGGLGVNVPSIGSGVTADFGDRLRVRGNTAGAWLYDNTLASDRGFVGLANANQIGFYGHHGAGWGLVMSVSNGFVGIGTTTPTNLLHVNGTVQALAYITGSDRNAKENIRPIEPAAILEKVVALPISTWTFKQEPNGTHLGPMAQDFHAAFGLGNTDTGIMTVDADGVALAAIQALAKKNDELRRENEMLRARLEAIERKLGL
jgi:hypothetical protein